MKAKVYPVHYFIMSAFLILISYAGNSQNFDTLFYIKQIHSKVDKDPQFPGGFDSLSKYINRNLICPKEAMKKKIQGSVIVSFIVNRLGTVDSVNILKSVTKECDVEALRLVYSLPKFTPGIINGIYVNTRLPTAVKFRCYK